MADPGDKGQWHGMSNVGADEVGDRCSGVEQDQSGHADRTGADRYNVTSTPRMMPAPIV